MPIYILSERYNPAYAWQSGCDWALYLDPLQKRVIPMSIDVMADRDKWKCVGSHAAFSPHAKKRDLVWKVASPIPMQPENCLKMDSVESIVPIVHGLFVYEKQDITGQLYTRD